MIKNVFPSLWCFMVTSCQVSNEPQVLGGSQPDDKSCLKNSTKLVSTNTGILFDQSLVVKMNLKNQIILYSEKNEFSSLKLNFPNYHNHDPFNGYTQNPWMGQSTVNLRKAPYIKESPFLYPALPRLNTLISHHSPSNSLR